MSVSKNRASKSALNRLAVQSDFEPDHRSEQLREIAIVSDPEILSALEAVFHGTGVMADQHKATLIVQVRQEVHAEWKKARQSFLAIGRSLLLLERTLTVEEFRRLTKGSDRIFPFTESIAVQLRRVADAVAAGIMSESEMPGSYSVAYQFAVMDGRTMEIARARNLVRPNVTRNEVIAFRREINVEQPTPKQRIDLANIRREKNRLQVLRTKLLQRLAEIDGRLAELSTITT